MDACNQQAHKNAELESTGCPGTGAAPARQMQFGVGLRIVTGGLCCHPPFFLSEDAGGSKHSTTNAGVPAALLELRAGDYFVGSPRNTEWYALILIRFDGGGNVQVGEVDLPGPLASGPVVEARVDDPRDDRVVAGLFVVAVAEDENGRRRVRFFRGMIGD